MTRRLITFAGLGFGGLLVVLALVVGGIYIRLKQGPMSATFIATNVEQAIANQFPEIKANLGEPTITLNSATGAPSVTFENVRLSDAKGNLIAVIPEAAVNLSFSDLLMGRFRAKSLDLFGPSILARRNGDGSIVLGFNAPEKNDAGATANANPAVSGQTSGADFLNLLDAHDNSNSISSLEQVRVSNAALRFYDDSNASTWVAPQINLAFQKKAYGFIVLAKGDIATTGAPWHAEISAAYHHDEARFDVSSTLANVIPAVAARKIYALSQFAAVTTPLTGHADFALDRAGNLILGKGEFRASPGQVKLPDYFAEPIAIDEGQFNIAFVPATGAFNIVDSTLRLGGRNMAMQGSIAPERGADGKLSALDIKLQTKAVTASEQPDVIDHIEFSGRAAIDRAWIDIDDLVVLSGNDGLRMRGNVAGGERSPAIHMAGRLRDVNKNLLQVLWPPIVAPKSRAWIFANVKQGLIPEGSFQINFAENELAIAHDNHRNPDGSIDFRFQLKDVTSHYFKSLPDIVGASGEAHVQDNNFTLTMAGGTSTLQSGEVIKLNSGKFTVDNLPLEDLTGHFEFDLDAPVSAMLSVASNPDIKMLRPETLATLPKASGMGHVKLDLTMPLVASPPPDKVQIKSALDITNVAAQGIVQGIDLTEGNFNVNLGSDRIEISGPAKINGQPGKISWSKPRNGGEATSHITATLDDKARDKLGLKLDDYLSGPVDVDVILSKDKDGNEVSDVKANLSQATMRLATLSWVRPPTENTTSSFHLVATEQGRSVQDFKLDGPGLRLRGAIELNKDSRLKLLNMSEIRLDEYNVFTVRAIPGDGTIDLTVDGSNLDARPYIKTVLNTGAKQSAAPATSTQDFTLHTHFDHVIAYRGEEMTNVRANLRTKAGRFAEASIAGSFRNGQTVNATLVPLAEGRQMKVSSNDAGSTLRAADLYSKIAGGNLEFAALIGNEEGSPLRNGSLIIRGFDVRNEAYLADIDKRGRPNKPGPRSESVPFKVLYLPFTADATFIRFKDGTIRGETMCATADGVIRKSDTALDISGTVVPACGLSRALNDVPIIGDILSGGNYNEGIFGLTYNVGGNFATPKVVFNPLSVLAPGVLRRLFDFDQRPAGKP